jgi:hypothetical protein
MNFPLSYFFHLVYYLIIGLGSFPFLFFLLLLLVCCEKSITFFISLIQVFSCKISECFIIIISV